MSGGKVKTRRHSLPSLPSTPVQSCVLQEQVVLASSSDSNSASAARTDGASRKRALNQAEVTSEAKRPAAVGISSEVSEGVHEAVSKEQLQVSEHTLCCLPGGMGRGGVVVKISAIL